MKPNIVVALVAILAFTACHKEDPNPTPTDTGTLRMHLHTYLDNNEVDAYNVVYTTDAGRRVSLSLAQMYLSQFELIRADGSTFTVPNAKILKVLDEDTYTIGDVPVGDYKSIRFRLGFGASDNQAAPSTDPALLDRPEMWFGASAQPDGYVFLHAKGTVDQTNDGTGPLEAFEYKIGTALGNVRIEMPTKAYTVVKDQATYLHMLADYNRIFNNLPWGSPDDLSVLTPADNSIPPATWIVQNVPSMFRYEEE